MLIVVFGFGEGFLIEILSVVAKNCCSVVPAFFSKSARSLLMAIRRRLLVVHESHTTDLRFLHKLGHSESHSQPAPATLSN